uniref:Breast carcinoma-amplified sequence 4 n=1 Tax=Bos mutus grunniens TaxID=30521 RepID=A0A8C0A5Q8_BOSMU
MLLVDADRPEPVRGGARELAVFLTPEPGAEAKEVEETIEGLLLRLEEFCSLADMIRSDTSQILEENIPLLKAKVVEMRGIYAKVDQLEAFVKMVRRHVSFLEAHVLQAERDHGALSQALRKWLGSSGLPALGNVDHTLEPQNPAHVWDGGAVFLLKWRMLSELGPDGVAVASQEQPARHHSGLG